MTRDQELPAQRSGKVLQGWQQSGYSAGARGKLRDRLLVLDNAERPEDVALPGWKLHPLKADLEHHWSIKVDRMWRLTFAFEGKDVILLDYQDYH